MKKFLCFNGPTRHISKPFNNKEVPITSAERREELEPITVHQAKGQTLALTFGKLEQHEPAAERMGKCPEAVASWQQQHLAEVKELGLDFVKTADSTIELQLRGMLLEIVFPAETFDSFGADDSILAISVDGSVPGHLLVALNEKFERVKEVHSAVAQVLDLVLHALRKFVANSNPLGRSPERDGFGDGKVDKHGQFRGKVPSASKSLVAGSVKCGSDGNNPINLSDDDDDDDDDMDYSESDHESDGYDAYGDFTGFEDDSDFPLAQLGSHIGLCAEIEEATRKCNEARRKAENSRQGANSSSAAFTSGSALTEEDDILRFCTVVGVRALNSVRIRAEVAGIVSSLKIATALGFTAQGTLQITLELDEKFWTRSSVEELKIDRITVKFSDNVERNCGNFHTEVGSSSRAGLQNEVAFAGQATCTTILLQELVNTYFDRRAAAQANPGRASHHGLLNLVRWATVKNPILGLVCFLGSQLKALPGCCVSCWNPLPISAGRIRTCQTELCLFKFEEMGLGAMAVLQEIKESPELIDFELSAGCAAVNFIRDVFEPFPAFLLHNQEFRGRSGFFSQAMPIRTQSISPSHQKTKVENKRLQDLLGALQSIPKVEDLLKCADENELRQKLASAAQSTSFSDSQSQDAESESTKALLPYNLLRFVLSTNRLSLLELKWDKLPLPVEAKYQFIALSDFPEKEARFARRKAQKGSFFAFHGSSACNWYSIMRNGLKSLSQTAFMTNGRAYGDGIYMASDFSTSYDYSTRSKASNAGTSWRNGGLTGMSVIAVCEVVNGICSTTRYGGLVSALVVPRANEDDVAIRYVIVVIDSTVPSPDMSRSFTHRSASITGSLLKNDQKEGLLNLERHHTDVKLKHMANLDVKLKEQRMTAMLKLKEENEDALMEQQPKSALNTIVVPSTSARPTASQPKRQRHTDGTDAVATAGTMQSVAKDLKNITREIRKAKGEEFLTQVEVTIPDEANMNVWNISLSQDLFKSNSGLHKDLTTYAKQRKAQKGNILLEAIFPPRYPFGPPFVRVIRPKFKFHTGHVTIGGSICMELLTDNGWLPSFSFESVLVQIVNAIVEGGGRLESIAAGLSYSREEAQAAFTRVAGQHRWRVSN